jgi:hypothetical protein
MKWLIILLVVVGRAAGAWVVARLASVRLRVVRLVQTSSFLHACWTVAFTLPVEGPRV